jgi:glyceraldehyde 3-phosphate dehydrogenase
MRSDALAASRDQPGFDQRRIWAASRGALSGIIRYSDDPIVSRNIVADPASRIFDAPHTQAGSRLVKIFGWYDNEWGYTQRLLDLAEYVGARLT